MGEIRLNGFRAAWRRRGSGLSMPAGVSVTIPDGAWVGVVGPNGSGKSTLLNGLAGFTPFIAGQFMVDSEPVKDLRDRLRAGIVLVRQDAWTSKRLQFCEATGLAHVMRPALAYEDAWISLEKRLLEFGWIQDNKLRPRVFELVAAIAAVPRVLLLDEVIPAFPSKLRTAERYREIKELLPRTSCVFADHNIANVLEHATVVIEIKDDGNVRVINVDSNNERKALNEAYGTLNTDLLEDNPEEDPWVHTVRSDQAVREQVELARRACSETKTWRKRLFSDFKFLDTGVDAQFLSGGQRTVLAFVVSTLGVGKRIPSSLLHHLHRDTRDKVESWMSSKRETP